MLKEKRGLFVAGSLLLLSACASQDVMLSGCEFVTGAYESEMASANRFPTTGMSVNTQEHDNSVHVVNGLLSAMFGTLVRAFSDDPDRPTTQECGE